MNVNYFYWPISKHFYLNHTHPRIASNNKIIRKHVSVTEKYEKLQMIQLVLDVSYFLKEETIINDYKILINSLNVYIYMA